MKTATVTDFRKNMKEYLNEIQNDQDFLVLTGPKKMDFVVLTLKEFNAMDETAYLTSTAANARRLRESIAQIEAGQIIVKDLGLDIARSRRKVKKKITAKQPK
jgi:antitoxin YefM